MLAELAELTQNIMTSRYSKIYWKRSNKKKHFVFKTLELLTLQYQF